MSGFLDNMRRRMEAANFGKTETEDYIREAMHRKPDERVKGTRGNYEIPFDGKKPQQGYLKDHDVVYVMPDGSISKTWKAHGKWTQVPKKNIHKVHNFEFEDVLSFVSITFSRSVRMVMESKRFDTNLIFTHGDAKKMMPKMLRGYISGRFVFKKHGNRYYATVIELY